MAAGHDEKAYVFRLEVMVEDLGEVLCKEGFVGLDHAFGQPRGAARVHDHPGVGRDHFRCRLFGAGLRKDVFVRDETFGFHLVHAEEHVVCHRRKVLLHFVRVVDPLVLDDQDLGLAVVQDVLHLGPASLNMRGTPMKPPLAAAA